MTLDLAINETVNGILYTNIAGVDWVIPLALTFLCMAIITRDIEKWKTMALPMMTLLHVAGIRQHYLFFIVAGLIYVLTNMSMSVMGNILQTAGRIVAKAPGAVAGTVKAGVIGTRTTKALYATPQGTTPLIKSLKGKEKAELINKAIEDAKKPKTTIGALWEMRRPKTKQEQFMMNTEALSKMKAKDRNEFMKNQRILQEMKQKTNLKLAQSMGRQLTRREKIQERMLKGLDKHQKSKPGFDMSQAFKLQEERRKHDLMMRKMRLADTRETSARIAKQTKQRMKAQSATTRRIHGLYNRKEEEERRWNENRKKRLQY